jgi:hypothetical protein
VAGQLRALATAAGDRTDGHYTGVDSHAQGELRTQRRQLPIDLRETAQDAEARAHGALGVVLVSDREAEVGKDSVAQELIDVPRVALDHALAGLVVDLDDLVQVLRLDGLAERGVTDQIAEEYRYMSALIR